jgi:hypothetical protein
MKIPGFKCRCAPRLNMFYRCCDLAPKIQAPSPLPANSVCTAFLRTSGFNQLYLSRATSISTLPVEAGSRRPGRDGTRTPSRALQGQGPETRAAVATSIRGALQPYQRGKQVVLAGAIWLVTANNALCVAPECSRRRFAKARALLNSCSFRGFLKKHFQLFGENRR